MKLILTLALFWATTLSQAALFDFATGATTRNATIESSTWAVDLATARQWYLAWAASSDRVYQRLINPGVNLTSGPTHPVNPNTLLSQAVFAGVSALLAAALFSAVKSVSRILPLSRRQLAEATR